MLCQSSKRTTLICACEAIQQVLLFKAGKKFFNCGCSFHKPRVVTIFVCMWTTKTGWKETERRPDVDNSHARRWFGKTNTILDGIPALDLWDLIVSVLGNTTQTTDWRHPLSQTSQKYQGKTNVLNNIIVFPQTSRNLILPVTQKIRHHHQVSSPNSTTKRKYKETCRVLPHQTSKPKTKTEVTTQHNNFDLNKCWLCAVEREVFSSLRRCCTPLRITKPSLKMIMKGRSPTMRHVSRNHRVALDWLCDGIHLEPEIQIRYIDTKQLADILTNLLHLFNISHISSPCCAQNFSFTSCTETMLKRMQEREGDNRIVAKSKPTTMNLAVCLGKFFDCEQSDCVEKIGDTQSTLWNRWVKYMATRCISGRHCRETCRTKIFRHSRKLRTLGNQRQWRRSATQSQHFIKLCAAHGEGLFDRETTILSQFDGSNERPRYEHSFFVYIYGWLFDLQFIQGKITRKTLRSTKNQPLTSLTQLRQVTERFSTDQTEITGLTTIDWQQPTSRETTLLTDRAVECATAKTFVFSDSVLCLGGMSDEPVGVWESRIKWFLETRYLIVLIGSTGSRWSSSGQDSPRWAFSTRLNKCESEQVKGRNMFR